MTRSPRADDGSPTPASNDAPPGEANGTPHGEPAGETPAREGDQERPPVPPVPATRASSVWLAIAPGLVLAVVVIVFIVENLQNVEAAFFGAHWTLPLGVDLLLAAVLGGLVVFLLGSLRILQLRRVARRHHAARRTLEDQRGTGHQA